MDRHGKQVVGYLGMGLNFMNPVVWESVTDLLKELYNRYDGVGDVVGLFNINGSWWLPGFTTYSGIVAAEVGYDDDSVEAFEKDTGIKLGIPATGAERFPKRYELLTGKYHKQWFEWRGKKLREKTGGNAEDHQRRETEMAALCGALEAFPSAEPVQHEPD